MPCDWLVQPPLPLCPRKPVPSQLGALLAGIMGELALYRDAALARQVLEEATRYKNCIVFSIAASTWAGPAAFGTWALPTRGGHCQRACATS